MSEAPPPDRDLLAEAERLIGELHAHPDADVREKVAALLERIDAIHRGALARLVAAIQGLAGDAFLNRLIADPPVRLLLMSYDLIAVDRRLQSEEALDAVRGELGARNVGFALTEVVGGVVYLRLDARGDEREWARGLLEGALREGLLGFQELVLDDRRASEPALIPLERLRPPRYRTAIPAADLPAGTLLAVELEDQPLLLVRLGDDVHALRNRCGSSPLPLEFGTLDGDQLVCSWHGCRYDVRTGARVDAQAESVAVYPVRVQDGRIEVAMATRPVTTS